MLAQEGLAKEAGSRLSSLMKCHFCGFWFVGGSRRMSYLRTEDTIEEFGQKA